MPARAVLFTRPKNRMKRSHSRIGPTVVTANLTPLLGNQPLQVLQRAPQVAAVWGWAPTNGATVTLTVASSSNGVLLASSAAATVANNMWRAQLPAQPASESVRPPPHTVFPLGASSTCRVVRVFLLSRPLTAATARARTGSVSRRDSRALVWGEDRDPRCAVW